MYIKLGDLVERLSLFLNGLVDFEAFLAMKASYHIYKYQKL